MTKLPSLSYQEILRALQRDGWVIIRQKGSHIRLQKHVEDRTLKLTVPAHRPVKRSTLSDVLKQADINARTIPGALVGAGHSVASEELLEIKE